MKNLITFIAVSFVLAACATTTPKQESTQTSQAQTQQATGVSQAQVNAQKLADEVKTLKGKSVYFDFDQSIVKPEYANVVQEQAQFVKAHGTDTVTLEGNCDERGSREYNLALGQRRANAVAQQLKLLGVNASQIKTISYGEERPRLTCHAERCWKVNRRVDFDHKLAN